MDHATGTVLTVCTANVCRSPLAERILQRVLTAPGITVVSAGVRAQTGAGMCPVSAERLQTGDPFGRAHVAKQVDRAGIVEADLLLAMEREQRSALVREAPGSQAKVFTLREAAAFAEALAGRDGGPARLGSVAELAAAMHGLRGLVPPPARPVPKRRWLRPEPEEVDPLTIEDGHGLDGAPHRAAVDEVHEMASRFARAAKVVLGA